MKILLIGNTPRTLDFYQAWSRDPVCVLEWHPRPAGCPSPQSDTDLVICEDIPSSDVRQLIQRTLRESARQSLALLYHPPEVAGFRAAASPTTISASRGARVLEFHAPLPARRRAVA